MAMTDFLTSFWRFDGCLSRRGYALRFITLIVAFLALLELGTEVFGLTQAEASSLLVFVEPIPGTVLALLFYWVSLALSAQRLRDMGFPVLPIIAALITFDGLENFVLRHLTEARLPVLDVMTPVGGVLSIATSLWLLVWPSATTPAPNSAPPDPSRRSGAFPQPPA